MALHLQGVSKTYANSVQTLKDITFIFSPGLYGSQPGISSRFKRSL